MKKILATLLSLTVIANTAIVESCDWNDRGDNPIDGDILGDFYYNGFQKIGENFPAIEIDTLNFASEFDQFVDDNWNDWKEEISSFLDQCNHNYLKYSFVLKKENITYNSFYIVIKLEDVQIDRAGYGSLEFNVNLYDHTLSDGDQKLIKEIVDEPIKNNDTILLNDVLSYLNNPSSIGKDIFNNKESKIDRSVKSSIISDNNEHIYVYLDNIKTINDQNNKWKQTFTATVNADVFEQKYDWKLQTTQEYKYITTAFTDDAKGNRDYLKTVWESILNVKRDDQKTSEEIDKKCEELGSDEDVTVKIGILKEFVKDIFKDVNEPDIQLFENGVWDISTLSESGILPFYNGDKEISEIKLW